MIFIPVISAVLGVLVALFVLKIGPLEGVNGQYLAVACLAGLDTIFGGVRSGLEGKFNATVFLTGFISNTLIAFFLAWLGDRIYIDLFFAIALVLGARMFTNLSLIRRFLLTRWQDANERKRLQSVAQAAIAASPEPNI